LNISYNVGTFRVVDFLTNKENLEMMLHSFTAKVVRKFYSNVSDVITYDISAGEPSFLKNINSSSLFYKGNIVLEHSLYKYIQKTYQKNLKKRTEKIQRAKRRKLESKQTVLPSSLNKTTKESKGKEPMFPKEKNAEIKTSNRKDDSITIQETMTLKNDKQKMLFLKEFIKQLKMQKKYMNCDQDNIWIIFLTSLLNAFNVIFENFSGFLKEEKSWVIDLIEKFENSVENFDDKIKGYIIILNLEFNNFKDTKDYERSRLGENQDNLLPISGKEESELQLTLREAKKKANEYLKKHAIYETRYINKNDLSESKQESLITLWTIYDNRKMEKLMEIQYDVVKNNISKIDLIPFNIEGFDQTFSEIENPSNSMPMFFSTKSAFFQDLSKSKLLVFPIQKLLTEHIPLCKNTFGKVLQMRKEKRKSDLSFISSKQKKPSEIATISLELKKLFI